MSSDHTQWMYTNDNLFFWGNCRLNMMTRLFFYWHHVVMISRHWHRHHQRVYPHPRSRPYLPTISATLCSYWIPKKLSLTLCSSICPRKIHKPDQVAALGILNKESQIMTCLMIKAGLPCWPNSQGMSNISCLQCLPHPPYLTSLCSPANGASQEVPIFSPASPFFCLFTRTDWRIYCI
jgi:hypothetical protein